MEDTYEVRILKKSGMTEWDDDKAAKILYGKTYDELDEDERADLGADYWDFVGHLNS